MYIFEAMLLLCLPEKCITIVWWLVASNTKPLLTWVLPFCSFTTPISLPKQMNQKVICLLCVFLLKIINAMAFFRSFLGPFSLFKKFAYTYSLPIQTGLLTILLLIFKTLAIRILWKGLILYSTKGLILYSTKFHFSAKTMILSWNGS